MKTFSIYCLAFILISSTAPLKTYADNCPPLTDFPIVTQVLGKGEIRMGDTLGDLKLRLDKIGTSEDKDNAVRYTVRATDNADFDIDNVMLDFQNGRLKWSKIIYKVAPIGRLNKAQRENEIEALLGKNDGYIQGPEGRNLKAWQKGSVIIVVDYNDTILWYMVELFDQGEMGKKVPPVVLKLLQADITGIDRERPESIDTFFATQVVLGPGFFKKYMGTSQLKEYGSKAIFKVPFGDPPKVNLLEGRVLLGIQRMVPLVAPEFEIIMAKYHKSRFREATAEERDLFYAFIDFEIKGKPIYILQSEAGRLLIYLEDDKRIKWIDYLDLYTKE